MKNELKILMKQTFKAIKSGKFIHVFVSFVDLNKRT